CFSRHFFLLYLIVCPPLSTLFPYTTLFRSRCVGDHRPEPHRRLRPDGELVHPGDAAVVIGADTLAATVVPEKGAEIRSLKAHGIDRKSTRLNSSHGSISYAVFCLKKKSRRL